MIVSFEEYSKKEKELENYKKSICKLIDRFIDIDPEIRKNHSIGKPYKGCFDFYVDNLRRGEFVIKYSYGNYGSDEIALWPSEYKKLKDFMLNPDLYLDSKKYNL